MKLLKPIRFDRAITVGGSSRPWILVLHNIDTKENLSYVVKLFRPIDIKNQHATGKEIIGNLLAKHFGLNVPDMGLTTFDDNFINHVLDDERRSRIGTIDPGVKFCSELRSGIIYSSTVHKRFLKDWDFANIYAFDCLCFNLDRGQRPSKPNILIENNDFLLIDHEQIFPFIDNTVDFYNVIMEHFNQKNRLYFGSQQHVFYPPLKELKNEDKRNIFDEFHENLALLNIDSLMNEIREFNHFSISFGDIDILNDYLCNLKKDASKFKDILIRSIA